MPQQLTIVSEVRVDFVIDPGGCPRRQMLQGCRKRRSWRQRIINNIKQPDSSGSPTTDFEGSVENTRKVWNAKPAILASGMKNEVRKATLPQEVPVDKMQLFNACLNDCKPATRSADFFMCGVGSDARGFLHDTRGVVSKALVPLGQARDLFKACSGAATR